MRVDLRKTLFILPNLFTLSSIFCGFYAILVCTIASIPMPALPGAASSGGPGVDLGGDVSADAFYNNGATSGSLIGTPFIDPAVRDC